MGHRRQTRNIQITKHITSGRPNVDLGGDSLLDIVQGRQLLIDDAAIIAISV